MSLLSRYGMKGMVGIIVYFLTIAVGTVFLIKFAWWVADVVTEGMED